MNLKDNMMKNSLKTYSAALLKALSILLVISFATTGCSEEPAEIQPTSEEVVQPAAKQQEPEKKYTTTEENCGPGYKHQHMIYEKTDVEKYESWQSCFPREAPLNDKEFWSEPRIMFSFYKEDFKDQQVPPPSLYSMRFDGTDVRLILRSDEIAGDNKADRMRNKALRSPNNRYIALSFDEGDRLTKVLFDLKEGTREVISIGGSKSNFIWTQDSENLIFYVDDRQKNYHIPTKKLTDRKIIYSSGGSLYLLNDGKTFLAARYNHLDYSDFSGNKIKTIQIPIEEFDYTEFLSLDNKFFYYGDGSDAYIFNVAAKKNVHHYPDWKYRPSSYSIFIPGTTKIIFGHRKKGLVIHDFASDTFKILFSKKAKGSFGIGFPSIINHPLLTGKASADIGK